MLPCSKLTVPLHRRITAKALLSGIAHKVQEAMVRFLQSETMHVQSAGEAK